MKGQVAKAIFLAAVVVTGSSGILAAEVKRLNNATDIASAGIWSEDCHVYVDGDVGLSSAELETIAARLTEIAATKNFRGKWYFLLSEHAYGERWRDPEGFVRRDLEAIRFAVGVGLFNQPAFTALKDSKTGLANGAMLIITFDPPSTNLRSVEYAASPLLKQYGLDLDGVWFNKVDQIAVDRLKVGFRIEAALLDSATEIENRLAQAILRREEQAARELRKATAKVASASEALGFLAVCVDSFRAEYPTVTGALIRPDMEAFKARLKNSEAALAAKDLGQAEGEANAVISAVNSHVKALQSYPQAEQQLAMIAKEYDSLKDHKHADGKLVKSSGTLVAVALQQWQNGDLAYVESLTKAQSAVAKLEKAIAVAVSTAWLVRVILWLCAIVIAVTVALILRSRFQTRSNVKKETDSLLIRWRELLTKKMLAKLQLGTEKKKILGEQSRSYSGESRKLLTKLNQALCDLDIFHGLASGALGEAEALVTTINPYRWLINLIDAGTYRRAVEILKQPIRFERSASLNRAFGQFLPAERDVLSARLEHFDGIETSFDQLITRFNETAEMAMQSLDRLKFCLLRVEASILELESKVDQIKVEFGALRDLLDNQEELVLPAVMGRLVPAIELELNLARRIAWTDPVAAMNRIEAVMPRCEVALAAVQQISSAAQNQLQQIDGIADDLQKEGGLETAWINHALGEIFVQSNNNLTALVNNSTSELEFSPLEQFNELLERCETIANLNALRIELLETVMPAVTEQVKIARGKLGKTFEIDKKLILKEEEANPDEMLKQAGHFLAISLVALNKGAPGSAQEGLGQAEACCQKASDIAEASEEAFHAYAESHEAIVAEAEALVGHHDVCVAIMEEILARFDNEVLLLGVGDSTHPRANDTVKDNLVEIDQAVTERNDLIAQAGRARLEGQILKATSFLQKAAALNGFIAYRYQEIRDKQQRLEKAEAKNLLSLKAMRERRTSLEQGVADFRTQATTVALFCQTDTLLNDPFGSRRNPFATEAQLSELDESLSQVARQVEADRDLYREVSVSADRAQEQLHKLERLLAKTADDDAPDSPLIYQARDQLAALKTDFVTFKREFDGCKHGDWAKLDGQVDRIFDQAGRCIVTISDEARRGLEALEQIQVAKGQTRQAANWSGSYGVSITGSAGKSELAAAERALTAGHYDEALRLATKAASAALHAISTAEDEVRRECRAEEERKTREAARRLKHEQQMRSSYSSSSSSSRGSGRFRSGTGGSSFGIPSSGVGGTRW